MWQPIETAPKDRTPMLLGRADKPVMCGRWYADGPVPGWYSDNIGKDAFGPLQPPTHWMPFPAPPRKGDAA